MMVQTTTTRRRELIVLCSLALLMGGGAFLYLLLIGGGLFLSVLAAVAALTVLGVLHYLLWGRWLQGGVGPREKEGFRTRRETSPSAGELIEPSTPVPNGNGVPRLRQPTQE